MPIKIDMSGENFSKANDAVKGVSNAKDVSDDTYVPNLFNQWILKVGRIATNPVTATLLLITYGFWLFNHGTSNSVIDVLISAAIEFTKAFYAFLAIFGCYRLFKIERLFGWRLLSGACIFWFTGEVVYGIAIINANKAELPVSFADWFFLATIPLAILGVFSVGMHGLKKQEKFRIALDSLAISATLIFMSLSYLTQQ